MPYLYELKLAGDKPSYTFVQQLIPVGTLVATGQSVATISDGAMEYHLPAPQQGLVVEWFVEHGDVLEEGDALARIVAEGEQRDVAAAVPTRLG